MTQASGCHLGQGIWLKIVGLYVLWPCPCQPPADRDICGNIGPYKELTHACHWMLSGESGMSSAGAEVTPGHTNQNSRNQRTWVYCVCVSLWSSKWDIYQILEGILCFVGSVYLSTASPLLTQRLVMIAVIHNLWKIYFIDGCVSYNHWLPTPLNCVTVSRDNALGGHVSVDRFFLGGRAGSPPINWSAVRSPAPPVCMLKWSLGKMPNIKLLLTVCECIWMVSSQNKEESAYCLLFISLLSWTHWTHSLSCTHSPDTPDSIY